MKFLKSLWAHLWCVPVVVCFLLMLLFAFIASGRGGVLRVLQVTR
jgi:hypothetical protein